MEFDFLTILNRGKAENQIYTPDITINQKRPSWSASQPRRHAGAMHPSIAPWTDKTRAFWAYC